MAEEVKELMGEGVDILVSDLGHALNELLLYPGASLHTDRSVVVTGLRPVDALAVKEIVRLANRANFVGTAELKNDSVVEHVIRVNGLLQLLAVALLPALPAYPTDEALLVVLEQCAAALSTETGFAGPGSLIEEKGQALVANLVDYVKAARPKPSPGWQMLKEHVNMLIAEVEDFLRQAGSN
ncbi:hypothetical protein E2562_003319 [Oryza meyeriana var. granulata]|uniref:Uncharacterized protein n=1 Tax=Oryza meyeriana var. granulata TaxID=110450 RepID=A0A6G1EDA3_9ORYZ|nr:hypothetical protein E2562_003319 [Oryza meyeriana var. granulata]